jgi:hypothetical protein
LRCSSREHGSGAIDVTLHQVPTEPVTQLRRAFEVQPIPDARRTQAGATQRLADQVGGEHGAVDVDHGQTHAIHRDGVTRPSVRTG